MRPQVRRPQPKSLPTGQVTPWRMTQATYEAYKVIGAQAQAASEFSQDWHSAIDRLKSLPGYPMDFIPGEGNTLQPIVVEPTLVAVH